MNNMTGKRLKSTLAAATLSAFCFLIPVHAEEITSYEMEPDTIYGMDLDNDGIAEQVSYSTYTKEDSETGSRAVLELYKDGKLFWSTIDESWSYQWTLNSFTLADDRTYFVASSISNSDWTNMVLLLAADGESVTIMDDLVPLTCQSEDIPENMLSAWARAGCVTDAHENTFTVSWYDSLMSTGNIEIPVTYIIEDGKAVPASVSYALDDKKAWTAWMDFDVQTAPDNETAAFHVAADEVVYLTEFTSIDGQAFLKCINENGQEGWYPDPEELYSMLSEDGESYLQGYFREAVFAG